MKRTKEDEIILAKELGKILGDFFKDIDIILKPSPTLRPVRRPRWPSAAYRGAFSFKYFEKKLQAQMVADSRKRDRAARHHRTLGALAVQFSGRAKRPAFFRACKGDKVFDVRHGWGKIVTLLDPLRTGRNLHVEVNFPDDIRRHYYRMDGRIKADDVNPSLYWDAVDIAPPARPERRTIIKYKLRFKPNDSPLSCVESIRHYKSVEDFKKQQPDISTTCACILESTAKEFPA